MNETSSNNTKIEDTAVLHAVSLDGHTLVAKGMRLLSISGTFKVVVDLVNGDSFTIKMEG